MKPDEILPLLIGLIGLVILMAGAGRTGAKAGGSILLVIVGFLLLALVFGAVVARTL